MKEQDIDKIEKAIEDILVVYPDVIEAHKSDDKITLLEGGALFVKHGVKIFRFTVSLPELAKELVDLDGEETTVLFDKISHKMGGSEEVKSSLRKIAEASGMLNQGIQELIQARKS